MHNNLVSVDSKLLEKQQMRPNQVPQKRSSTYMRQGRVPSGLEIWPWHNSTKAIAYDLHGSIYGTSHSMATVPQPPLPSC